MPVSKKRKHPQKRTSSAAIPDKRSDTIMTIHVDYDPEEFMQEVHAEGIRYYNRGRRDKAGGTSAMTLNRFTKVYDLMGRGFDDETNHAIAEAQYSIYLDGYTGTEYCERVTFEQGCSL